MIDFDFTVCDWVRGVLDWLWSVASGGEPWPSTRPRPRRQDRQSCFTRY